MINMKKIEFGLDGHKILQIPNISHKQMMAYVVFTPNHKAIVIDVGLEVNVDYMIERIRENNCSEVELLFITHAHCDHFNGIYRFAEKMNIKKLCYQFPPYEWLKSAEPGSAPYTEQFEAWEKGYEGQVLTPKTGDNYEVDGLKIHVLKDCSDYLEMGDENPINDTSTVIRLEFPNGKTGLFLGDLGWISGAVLEKMYGSELKSDIVQMAHHGQNGVNKSTYRLIAPEVCLWPTPDWLWTNNYHNSGYNKGHFKTLIVRRWIRELGVKLYGNQKDGEVWVI